MPKHLLIEITNLSLIKISTICYILMNLITLFNVT